MSLGRQTAKQCRTLYVSCCWPKTSWVRYWRSWCVRWWKLRPVGEIAREGSTFLRMMVCEFHHGNSIRLVRLAEKEALSWRSWRVSWWWKLNPLGEIAKEGSTLFTWRSWYVSFIMETQSCWWDWQRRKHSLEDHGVWVSSWKLNPVGEIGREGSTLLRIMVCEFHHGNWILLVRLTKKEALSSTMQAWFVTQGCVIRVLQAHCLATGNAGKHSVLGQHRKFPSTLAQRD